MQELTSQTNTLPMNGSAIEGYAFWEKQMLMFKQGKLSRKSFCLQNGLNYNRFQYWYHKLEQPVRSLKPNTLLPVRLKPTLPANQMIGTLLLGDKNRLLIHNQQALDHVLARLS